MASQHNCNTLSQTVEEFADSFGPKSAYMGWAWTMNAGRAQNLTGQFVQFLKHDKIIGRARTVQEARLRLVDVTYDPARDYKQEAKLMKVYGDVENVIDMSVKGGSNP